MQEYLVRLKKVFVYFSHGIRIGEEPAMDIRQFVYMFQALGLADKNISICEVCQTCVASVSFMGIPEADRISFEGFLESFFNCIDVKTFDGLCTPDERLNNFLMNDFFPKIKAKTDLAIIW
mmetsp:Transcript_14271/g.22519  ORF Transcript_14271/g.22519 Transcript_14271/m.22519 type:complete len:121 (-) Transcript_14271:135-497(-)